MEVGRREEPRLTLVGRKPCLGLPTACPICLPVYIYLKFSKVPFDLEFNLIYPDSDAIPFVESGYYVANNNEKGGVIQKLKKDGIVDLDSRVSGIPEWVSMKALVELWLGDALMYELWLASDGKPVNEIYYSDVAWLIGKILHFKQVRIVKQLLGITPSNAERREEEIYSRAELAYGTLSTRLGEQTFFFENRCTSLDADFLAHVLFTLHALPETSVLKNKLLAHPNLVNNAENLKLEYIEASSSSLSVSQYDPSSSAPRRGPTHWTSKPKSKPKREMTEEEKKLRRRAKFFLVAQFVSVLVFLSVLDGSNEADIELEEDDSFCNMRSSVFLSMIM